MSFIDRLHDGPVLFDGGMGSSLIARGLETGQAPEAWNVDRADVIAGIHSDYLGAGADVITTNTFGSTPARMSRHGLSERFGEINRAGVALARTAVADAGAGFVALSLGPTGMMFPPMGDASDDAIAHEFAGQLDALEGGFDLVVIETVFDLREGLIALAAAKERVAVPVVVTVTFGRTPRGFYTVMGNDVASTVRTLDEAGADVIGANCSIASGDMLELAPLLRAATARPLLCQPNAGQPRMEGTRNVYDQTPAAFADDAVQLFELGVSAVGGCCGTDAAFIAELRGRIPR